MIDEKHLLTLLKLWRKQVDERGTHYTPSQWLGRVIEEIEYMPKVEDCIKNYKNCWKTKLVNPQWIPCSERLPNVSRCIVDVGYLMDDGKFEHDIKIVDFEKWQSGFRFIDDWRNNITDNVIAWQPLPEPYKEGDT